MKRLLIMLFLILSASVAYAKPPKLAVEELFDGRYNNEKGVSISVSKDEAGYYRGLSVRENEVIVRAVVEAVNKDIPKAYKYYESEGDDGYFKQIKIENNGKEIIIGLTHTMGYNAFIYIKGKCEAFE